jgi:chloramphenicol-sensitive protein RarD
MIFVETSGVGVSGNLPWHFWILIGIRGIVTAVPLMMYSEATKRLPLNVVGFLQYIGPTIMLILGVFVFKEPFDKASAIPFIMIWIGLVFFTYSQYKYLKQK